ncbi:DinB family protein [Methylocystis sp. MJC1]|uniref:DinB family protein n=2 Tax=Methylocystis sp. MJC1 TaxID=2654282 RepID=UPI0027D211E6|nr:DinB family protein [Methylocystis sp. MJC1]
MIHEKGKPMIDPSFARTMARYNQWQNQNLYSAADALSDEERRKDRGAFFKSIHATLNHLLWGDHMWLSRFAGGPQPECSLDDSNAFRAEWAALKADREQTDLRLIDWADSLDAAALEGELAWYSGLLQRTITKPKQLAVVHIFNHQTHHRGQVHAMLTAAGARPHGTDLAMMNFS